MDNPQIINEYICKKIEGTWKQKHKQVIDEILRDINAKTSHYILKGGTALMECYGLSRFSEDIDLDSNDKETIKTIIDKFSKQHNYDYRIAKDTNTVTRFFIDYKNTDDNGGAKPLKIEISHRRKNIPENEYTIINGIAVYKLDYIAVMKANAYQGRDKLRDMYDITYIINEKSNELQPMTLSLIRNAVEQKGIEQYDYITTEQHDDLIDNEELATSFLKMFDTLELITNQEKLMTRENPNKPIDYQSNMIIDNEQCENTYNKYE